MTTGHRPLNADILLEVFDILHDTSPRSLLNVALTCRAFYKLSKIFIYRALRLNFNRDRRDINGRLIRRLLRDGDLCSKVRCIRIDWAPNAKLQPGEGSKEELELLGQALPKLGGLKLFIWDAQYPIISWLLDSLRSCPPGCKLYIHHAQNYTPAHLLARLRDLPSLTGLDVSISDWHYQANRELEKILISSPISDLAIRTGTTRMCLDTLAKASVPLQLNSLEIVGHIHGIRELPILWSRLNTLILNAVGSLGEDLPALHLDGLKSLELRLGIPGSETLLYSILKSSQKLESLSLTGDISFVWGWERSEWRDLGKTLVKLRIYGAEAERGPNAGILPDYCLMYIAEECPNIRSLGIDLKYDREWPIGQIEVIAEYFWFAVHFEFNLLTPQHPGHTLPRPTLTTVENLWALLWQCIQSSRTEELHTITLPRLRSLDVVVGTDRRFNVDISERDDEAREGVAKVRCAELEALKSKLSSSEPRWNHEQLKIVSAVTKRATYGIPLRLPSTVDPEMMRPPAFRKLLDEDRFHYRFKL